MVTEERALHQRPKRSRHPVERLTYAAPQQATTKRRRSEELLNMDQYSTDEEFDGGVEGEKIRTRYNNKRELRPRQQAEVKKDMRLKEKVKKERDTSSSSSNNNTDEEKFVKRKAKRMNIERSKLRPLNMDKKDVTKAIFRERQKVGCSMADVAPMEMDMGVTFQSIGGLEDHINSLREMVLFPLLYPELFCKFNMVSPKGVLFYGPPGTGKTLMARALACECSQDNRKVAFFMRKGADCLSKWIGESERQLRLLFEQAYLMRPSIIFFDEIDGLAPVRSSRQDQIHSSIVSTLLALMDGLDNRGEIIVIGATNRIENIDPALRRPGRFDRELRFSLPTINVRKEILSLYTKTWEPPVEEDLIERLSEKTVGYCGADLRGLCAEALLGALKRRYPQVYRTNQKLALDLEQIKVIEEDFYKAMNVMVPSTHRVSDQSQAPLSSQIRPLLETSVKIICQKVGSIIPTGSSSVQFSFRPRLLIAGKRGQGLTTYIGPAVLHAFEKLPCYRLDSPNLYANTARTPEEALFHLVHEAKRTVPSILYIPHFLSLWRSVMTESMRETFLSLLSDILPTTPLLVLAVSEMEQLQDLEEDCIIPLIFSASDEVYLVQNPSCKQRSEYFKSVFEAALKHPPTKVTEHAAESAPEEIIPVVPLVSEHRELTEKEERRLRRKEEALLRELRIFLRDVWNKINREQKFFMFRVPVDTEELYDYLDFVKKPMDFDQMLSKLDDKAYNCAQDFLDDVDLIVNNAITYNSDLNYETNKIVCHRAKALKDFAYALVKTEMDTDFEDECKEIVLRRKELTAKIASSSSQQTTEDVETLCTVAVGDQRSATENHSKLKKTSARRRHIWAKGLISERGRKKRRHHINNKDCNDSIKSAADHLEEDESTNKSTNDSVISVLEAEENSNNGCVETLRIDEEKLVEIETRLVNATENFTVELLEKLFCKLMELVLTYKETWDRISLTDKLETLLPPITLTDPSLSPAGCEHS